MIFKNEENNIIIENKNINERGSKSFEDIINKDPERQFVLHLDLKDIQLSKEELEANMYIPLWEEE